MAELLDGQNTGEEGKKEPIPIGAFRESEDEKKEKISEIEVDLKKKPADNKQPFSVKGSSFVKDFITQPTTPSDSIQDEDKPKESVAEIRARLEQEEKEEINKLSVEDFEDAADFIIDLIDMALMFGIRWYSMDISDAEYKVPEEKLKKLKKHLARLLMRMGKKFPMGVLFVLAVVAAYATPIRKAYEHRKKVSSERARKQMNTSTKKSGKTSVEDEEGEEEDEPKYVPIKKRRGGQAK